MTEQTPTPRAETPDEARFDPEAMREIDRLRHVCDLVEVRLRRLHYSYGARCWHCKTSWPCATEQVLRAAIREAQTL